MFLPKVKLGGRGSCTWIDSEGTKYTEDMVQRATDVANKLQLQLEYWRIVTPRAEGALGDLEREIASLNPKKWLINWAWPAELFGHLHADFPRNFYGRHDEHKMLGMLVGIVSFYRASLDRATKAVEAFHEDPNRFLHQYAQEQAAKAKLEQEVKDAKLKFDSRYELEHHSNPQIASMWVQLHLLQDALAAQPDSAAKTAQEKELRKLGENLYRASYPGRYGPPSQEQPSSTVSSNLATSAH